MKHKPNPNEPNPNEPDPNEPDPNEPGLGDGGGADPCAASEFLVCTPISEKALPATKLAYVTRVEALSPRWTPTEGTVVELACNPVDDVVVHGVAAITFEQSWSLQKIVRGEPSTVVSLAPGERLALRVTKTQRNKLDQTTIDSKSSIRSNESQTNDNQMLEVARTVTENEQWQLNASVGVEAGPASVNVSTGYQQSVQEQASTKAQEIREATQKASNELRSVSKVEVTHSSEVERIDESVRVVENPFRDRALNITVFELRKVFCVSQRTQAIAPELAIELPRIRMDRSFILRNGDFLANELIDTRLAADLQESLRTATTPSELAGREERLIRLARRAFDHLYVDRDVIFEGDPARYDFKDQVHFDYLRPKDAWHEASNYAPAAELYMLLGSFRKLIFDAGWFTVVADDESAFTRVELVLALAKQVRPLWEHLESSHRTAMFDTSHFTAIYRRIPAFLTLVERMIRPLVEGGDGASTSRRRLDAVLLRMRKHLGCFASHYSQRFHEYLWVISNRKAHITLARQLLTVGLELPAAEREALARAFDPERVRLAGTTMFIPHSGDAPSDFLESWFPADDTFVPTETWVDTVVVPADGASLEPSAGHCLLSDVPEPVEDATG